MNDKEMSSISIPGESLQNYQTTCELLSGLTKKKIDPGKRLQELIESDFYLIKHFVNDIRMKNKKNEIKFEPVDPDIVFDFIYYLSERPNVFYFVGRLVGFTMTFPEIAEQIENFSTELYNKKIQGKE